MTSVAPHGKDAPAESQGALCRCCSRQSALAAPAGEQAEAAEGTDYTDITRIGILNLGSRATTGMYFDNLDLRDIPEPTTLALLGLGAALAAWRRRRRD